MSLFRHGKFLATFFFIASVFFALEAQNYGLVGLRVRVAGKISVAGNARKRALQFTRGRTSAGCVRTRATVDFYLVRTTTGCLGLTVWLFHR